MTAPPATTWDGWMSRARAAARRGGIAPPFRSHHNHHTTTATYQQSHHHSHHPPPQQPPARVATVTTLRDVPPPMLSPLSLWHLKLGFSRIFLYFDDPDDAGIAFAKRLRREAKARATATTL